MWDLLAAGFFTLSFIINAAMGNGPSLVIGAGCAIAAVGSILRAYT